MQAQIASPARAAGPAAQTDRASYWHFGILSPGVRLMRRLDFKYKATVLSLLILAPLVFLGYQLLATAEESLQVARSERVGVAYFSKIIAALRATQDHRGLANRLLNGDQGAAAALDDQTATWTAAIDGIAEIDKAHGGELGVAENLAKIQAKATALNGRQRSLTAPESFAAHTDIARDLIALVGQVGDASGLVLDPDADSYYTMLAMLNEGPHVAESIAVLRGAGAGVLAAKLATPKQREAMIEVLVRLQVAHERQSDAIAAATKATPALQEKFAFAEAQRLSTELMALVRSQPLAATPDGDPAAYWSIASKALDAQYGLLGRAQHALDDLLVARMDRLAERRLINILVATIFLALSVYMSTAAFKVLNGGMTFLSSQILQMSNGDFSARPWPWGKDEVADSVNSLRVSLVAVSNALRAIRERADQVSHGAREIAAGNQDLSSRTEASASAIEESARHVDALTERSHANAQSIDAAAHQLNALLAHAHTSEQTVRGLVDRMTALHGQSREIAEIVGMIDGIAFQTNILALNASVEAARAGDMGRGFAVVAQEVRALAQRAADAARQIKTIIAASNTEIEAGSALATRAGEAVAKTVQSVQSATSTIGDVRAGVGQTDAQMREVNVAINQLAGNTQGNAALVEQVASATSALDQSAEALRELVVRFKLGKVG